MTTRDVTPFIAQPTLLYLVTVDVYMRVYQCTASAATSLECQLRLRCPGTHFDDHALRPDVLHTIVVFGCVTDTCQ